MVSMTAVYPNEAVPGTATARHTHDPKHLARLVVVLRVSSDGLQSALMSGRQAAQIREHDTPEMVPRPSRVMRRTARSDPAPRLGKNLVRPSATSAQHR